MLKYYNAIRWRMEAYAELKDNFQRSRLRDPTELDGVPVGKFGV